mmetsp:Transcript_41744/g.82429  ORF Transcript_41744/g.82429 Transcript_41744/m.82429 type:complete len:250 (-) Transcript_41744:306-1055(-)
MKYPPFIELHIVPEVDCHRQSPLCNPMVPQGRQEENLSRSDHRVHRVSETKEWVPPQVLRPSCDIPRNPGHRLGILLRHYMEEREGNVSFFSSRPSIRLWGVCIFSGSRSFSAGWGRGARRGHREERRTLRAPFTHRQRRGSRTAVWDRLYTTVALNVPPLFIFPSDSTSVSFSLGTAEKRGRGQRPLTEKAAICWRKEHEMFLPPHHGVQILVVVLVARRNCPTTSNPQVDGLGEIPKRIQTKPQSFR